MRAGKMRDKDGEPRLGPWMRRRQSQSKSAHSRQTSEMQTSKKNWLWAHRLACLACLVAFGRATDATSQINTIWLARESDENQPLGSRIELHTVSQQQQQFALPNNNHPATQSTANRTLNSVKLDKRFGQTQLSQAASSLQPAIASDESISTSVSQRRSGSAEPARFKLARIEPTNLSFGNGQDDSFASGQPLLDNLLSTGTSTSPNSSGQQQQNSQVQFDEEANVHYKRDDSGSVTIELAPQSQQDVPDEAAQRRSTLQSSHRSAQRRQDNETTSTLTPQHHEAPLHESAIQFDEGHKYSSANSSRPSVQSDMETAVPFDEGDSRRNPSGGNNHEHQADNSGGHFDDQRNRTNNNLPTLGRRRPEPAVPAPPIYYLPDGDKWNSHEFHHHRQSLANGEETLPAGRPNFSAPFAIQSGGDSWPPISQRPQQQQNRHQHSSVPQYHGRPFASAPVASHLSDAQLKPLDQFAHNNHNSQRSFYRTQAPLTTGLPGHPMRQHDVGVPDSVGGENPFELPMLVRHPSSSSSRNDLGQQQQFAAPRMQMPLLPPSLPFGSHQLPFAPNGQLGSNGNQHLFSHQRPVSLASATRPHVLVRHSRMPLAGSSRRKSILSKFNQWATGGGGGGVDNTAHNHALTDYDELAKATLESAFYGTRLPNRQQPARGQRLRPGARPLAPPLRLAPSNVQPQWPPHRDAYQQLGGHTMVQVPTVAPALSALNQMSYGPPAGSMRASNFYSPTASRPRSLIQQSSSQQPASFIPVVAVQVTRTSPAPVVAADTGAHTAGENDDTANEIDNYLESQTGQRGRKRRGGSNGGGQLATNWDNVAGDQTLVDNTRHSSGSATSNSIRHQLHVNHPMGHETSVTKSAVFGYLPQQADGPLLQAMNVLQQMPGPGVQQRPMAPPIKASSSSSHYQHQQQQQQNSNYYELYANQMDRSKQALKAATPLIQQQAYMTLTASQAANLAPSHQLADDASLSLQLQANNYMQNEIAHPFSAGSLYTAALPSSEPTQRHLFAGHNSNNYLTYGALPGSGSGSGSSASEIRPMDVLYPSDQFLQQQQQQLVSSLLAEQQQYQRQLSSRPLSSGAQLFATRDLSAAHQQNQQFADAFVLAAPTGIIPNLDSSHFGLVGNEIQSTTSAQDGQQESQNVDTQTSPSSLTAATTAPSVEDSSGGETNSLQQDNENTKSTSKGKKRSSEFFANAGQLLLSALPLLLAPTLGLMFASAPVRASLGPGHVARLHQQPNQAPMQPQLSPNNYDQDAAYQPSSYASNSLDGLVSNASPSPQFFTPIPPGNGGGYGVTVTPPPQVSDSQDMDSAEQQQYQHKHQVHQNQHRQHHFNNQNNQQHQQNEEHAKHLHRQQQEMSSINRGVTLPALTGFKVEPTGKLSNRGALAKSNGSTSTTSRPALKTLVITTLSPGSHLSSPSSSSSSSNSSSGEPLSMQGEETSSYFVGSAQDLLLELGGLANNSTRNNSLNTKMNSTVNSHSPTIIILEGAEHEESDLDSNSTAVPNEVFDNRKSNSSIEYNVQMGNGLAQATARDATTTTSTTSSTNRPQYDTGYQGADFDAQFPALQTTGRPRQPSPGHDHVIMFVKDKNRYKYSELQPSAGVADNTSVVAAATVDQAQRRLLPTIASAQVQQEAHRSSLTSPQAPIDDVRLFPVSAWPSLSRRTVSLITSHGNRTLYKSPSQHRYVPNTLPAASHQVHQSSGSTGPGGQSVSASVHFLAAEGEQLQRTRSNSRLPMHDNFIVDNKSPDAGHDLQTGGQVPLFHSSGRTDRLLKRTKRQANDALASATTTATTTTTTTEMTQLNGTGTGALTEHKRPASKKKKKRRRVVVKRIKMRRNDDQEATELDGVPAAASGAEQSELLDKDASRRKSAIVTAMITHLPSGQADSEPERASLDSQDERLDEELRAHMLHKKMLLERLASRSHELSADDLRTGPVLRQSSSAITGGGLVGRGPLKPIQLELSDSSNSTLLREHYALGDRLADGQQELAEDTQRALAKFGSLLLEDTLQFQSDQDDQQLQQQQITARRRRPISSARLRLKLNHDSELASSRANDSVAATERYSSYSGGRPTQAPEDWRHSSLNESHYAQNDLPLTRSRVYSMAPSDTSVEMGARRSQQFGERNWSHDQRLAQQQLTGNIAKPDSPVGRYQDFLQTHVNRTSSARQTSDYAPSHNRSSTGSAQQQEPLDARFSTYSNYSTPYNDNDNYNYHGGRRDAHHPPPATHYQTDYHQADYHHTHGRPYTSDSQYYYNNNNSNNNNNNNYNQHNSTYMRPGYYTRDDYAHSSMPHQSAPPPPPPPSAAHHSSASSSPGPDNRYAPPLAAGVYDPNHHHSATTDPRRGYHQTGFHSSNQPLQEVPDSSARSVNDYLKRVQFNDSDRDKLMASYLTCDGLLNDNDHCLERLSCEFSDPLNIERANKLDRAVSSILLGHILINTYIPNSFKLRLKSASLYGYTQSGKCSKFACSKLTNSVSN